MNRAEAVASPVPIPGRIEVRPGIALLDGIGSGPGLAAHEAQYGPVPYVSLDELLETVRSAQVRGRGGAAFPFAVKLEAAAKGRRPVVVVNLSEGEPASAKDSALATTRPHLVLDGAVATARALGAPEVHLVLPGDRPRTCAAIDRAVAERRDPVAIIRHVASPRFVAGQAKAVTELMSGRPNLPVTAWVPDAVSGYKSRPTLLSNAETWAHVGRLLHVGPEAHAAHGASEEPGTTLLTVSLPGRPPVVREVAYGSALREVMPAEAAGGAVLLGGFHGTWASWRKARKLTVSVPGFASAGLALGAGVVHLPGPEACPVTESVRIVEYLAGQSARRCGPCFNGLPALASALRTVHDGGDALGRVDELADVVVRRGACAHPDGTVRMVRSLLTAYADEVAAHTTGRCLVVGRPGTLGAARRARELRELAS